MKRVQIIQQNNFRIGAAEMFFHSVKLIWHLSNKHRGHYVLRVCLSSHTATFKVGQNFSVSFPSLEVV